MSYMIGIDIGTSGAKTLLIDEQGAVLANVTVEYPMYTPHPQWAEQDPQDWWEATVSSIGQALCESGIDVSEIKGIGLTGQMHGMVMLDAQGEVLRPCIMWNDQRTAAQCASITERVGAEGKLFGSVTTAEVVTAVAEQFEIDLDRRDLHIDEPIREVGTHKVTARPHPDVQFEITVEVVAAD